MKYLILIISIVFASYLYINIVQNASGQGSVGKRTQTNTLRQSATSSYQDARTQPGGGGGSTNPVQTNSGCLRIKGTVTATNWKGGSLMVGCTGDSGTAGCRGGVQSVSPGGSFDLPLCTCSGNPPKIPGVVPRGCLAVGSNLYLGTDEGRKPILGTTTLPNGCKLTGGNPVACGDNGNTITANVNITCPAPSPVATNTPVPTNSPTPIPTNTPVPTGTPTPTPTPTSIPTPSACPYPPQVVNVKVTCPNCPTPTP